MGTGLAELNDAVAGFDRAAARRHLAEAERERAEMHRRFPGRPGRA